MSIRHSSLAAAATLFAVCGTAFAEDKIVTMLSSGEDGGHSVGFDYDGCGGECYIGGLSCNSGGGNVEFAFGDVESTVAGSIVGSEDQAFRVSAGGVSVKFAAYRLQFQEMTGTWAMDGHTFEETGPLLAAIAKSKTFSAEAGSLKLELPVTDDVKSWVKNCGG
jgi:hypothetical protein